MGAIAVATTKFNAKDGYSSVVKKMQQTTGSFVNKASAGFNQLTRNANVLNNNLKGVNRTLNKGFNIGMRSVGIGVAAAGGFINQFVKEASRIEDATASFTPLLGSTEKATKLVERLNKEAATTPFQFEGIAGVAKQLLPVMNGSIEDTANTFRMLGDTAGGDIQKLESITRGYTKAMLKGKPDMESLNMIAEAGVPIFEQMAKSMGLSSTTALFELSKQGKLTTDDLTKTFKTMTSEGGIFFKGMEISSKTFSGKISTMKDNIALAFSHIGNAMLPILKEYADKVTNAAQVSTKWIKENQELIKTRVAEYAKKIGSFFMSVYKISKSLFLFFSKYGKTILNIATYFLIFATVLKIITVAMSIYTAITTAASIATLAIPLAIAAVIAGIIMLIIYWDKVKAAIDNFFESAGMFSVVLLPLQLIWEAVKSIIDIFNAFKVDGFIGGLKQIGESIISLLLLPLESVLQTLSAIGIAEGAYQQVKEFRASMQFDEANTPAVNTQATIEQVRTERKETNNNATVTINDNTGRAEMSEMPAGMKVVLNNTSGSF